MKKVLSLVLVIAMVLSSMSFAFAAPKFEDIADTDYAKAIETLTALGVVTGYEDGTYRPEKVVTRAEMAKLMVEILGYGDLVAGSKSNFSDTQGHWADAWIALAAGKNIVVGTGDGKFTPDRTVTYDEAITMVVRALGYTDNSNELKTSSWPTNFKIKAAELGLTKGVKLATAGADRGGVAQLLFNALTATLVTVNSDGDVIKSTTQTTDSQGKVVVEYTELLSRVATYDPDYKVDKDTVNPKSKYYAGNNVDLNSFMYQSLKVYLNDDDEVVYVKGSNSIVIEGTVDSVDTANKKFVVKDADGDKYTIDLQYTVNATANEVDMFYNGAEVSGADINDIKTAFEKITVVGYEDGKGNDKIDKNDELVGFVAAEQTDVVRIEKAYIANKTKLDGLALPTDDGDVDLDNITVTGAADTLEDVKVDDVVVQYSSVGNTVTKLVVSRDTVDGKVTRVKDADTFLIDGTSHDLSAKYLGAALILGSEGVFYLDHNGDIADFDGDGEGPTNYAVVIGVEDGNLASKFSSVSIDNYPQIKLATQDGETVVYDLYVKLKSTGAVDGTFTFGTTALTDYFTGTIADHATADELVVKTGAKAIPTTSLVKYSLNADGKVDQLEVVLSSFTFAQVDFEKATNLLSDDVVVFDATSGDYKVVDESVLPTKPLVDIVRDNNGKIEVVVVKSGEIDTATDVVFAYIYDADPAYNEKGSKVQLAGVYTDNADNSVYTTKNNTITLPALEEGVYAIKYDGAAIKSATIFGSYVPQAGESTTGVVTASAVNAKGAMVKIGAQWYAMSENATVLDMNYSATKSAWLVNDLADLYDIEKEVTQFEAYINADGEIDLILIK